MILDIQFLITLDLDVYSLFVITVHFFNLDNLWPCCLNMIDRVQGQLSQEEAASDVAEALQEAPKRPFCFSED